MNGSFHPICMLLTCKRLDTEGRNSWFVDEWSNSTWVSWIRLFPAQSIFCSQAQLRSLKYICFILISSVWQEVVTVDIHFLQYYTCQSNLGIFCFICYVNVSRSPFRIQTPVGIGNRRRSGKTKLYVTRGIKSCTHKLNDLLILCNITKAMKPSLLRNIRHRWNYNTFRQT